MKAKTKYYNMRNTKNIFLVEDDKDDQYFFTEALHEIKHAKLFAIASNGQDALEKLKNSMMLPDVIFTDINMPLLSGIGFLQTLLKTSRLKNIPVVVLSTDEHQGALAKQLGAKAFIKKTYDGNLLRQEIHQVINQHFKVFCTVERTFDPRPVAA